MGSHDSSRGAVWNYALFIAGNTIGAGVLGLPVAMGDGGFFASTIACILLYLLVIAPGLGFAHIFCRYPSVDLPTFFRHHLGKLGFFTFSIAYFILFFCLLIAYWAGLHSLFHGHSFAILSLTLCLCSIIFLLQGNFNHMHFFVTILMAGLFISFFGLMMKTFVHEGHSIFQKGNWRAVNGALPVIFCSYGFQAAIPMVCRQLQYNIHRVRRALIYGTLFPLIFNLLILFISYRTLSAEELVHGASRGLPVFLLFREKLLSPLFLLWGECFIFFAIGSSLLGVTATFCGALRDVIHCPRKKELELFLAVFVPFLIAIYWPNIFLSILQLASGIFLNIIGGILPVIVLFKYGKKSPLHSLYLCGFLHILFVEIAHLLT
jgi:tyrosine-specific transport protein